MTMLTNSVAVPACDRQTDGRTDEQCRHLVRTAVDDVQIERVADDHKDQQNGQRQFDDEEHCDDGDQHQRGPVALGQAARLAAAVLLQQQLTAVLGPTHGIHQ